MIRFDYSKQTALVTGGTRGIGRAISESFLKSGAAVVAVYAGNDEAALKFKESLGGLAERLIIKKCDVSSYESVESLFKEMDALFADGVQIVVNNSGIRRDAVLAMMKAQDWREVLDVNLTGTFNVSKFAVLSMIRKRYGRIINITSPCGKFGFEGQSNYAASKAGQVALTRSLSKEVASRGITVNCVSPGFIATDLIGDLPDKLRENYRQQIPLKKFGAPEDVANCVLFLASAEAAYVTGSLLEVTGGL